MTAKRKKKIEEALIWLVQPVNLYTRQPASYNMRFQDRNDAVRYIRKCNRGGQGTILRAERV